MSKKAKKSDIKLPIQNFGNSGQDNIAPQSLAVQGYLNTIADGVSGNSDDIKNLAEELKGDIKKSEAEIKKHYEDLSKRILILNTAAEDLDEDYHLFQQDTFKNFELVNDKINKLESKKGFFGKIWSWLKGLGR